MQYQKYSIPKRNEYCKIHNMKYNVSSILNTKLRIDIKTEWYMINAKTRCYQKSVV